MAVRRSTTQRERDRTAIAATRANCYICGQPIDYTARHPDPWSFVVDHVVPLEAGGADDLTNKRAAHRRCNTVKGMRPYAPIIRRSGVLAAARRA